MKEAVIVTGGIKRLGLVFAKKTLEMGYKAIIHYRSDVDATAENLASQYPGDVLFVQRELTDNPESLIDIALEYNVSVCGLVNNASVFSTGNMSDIGHFEELLSINTIVPARLNAAFSRKIGKGWIINISDANIHAPNLNYQNYRISKLLLEEFTRQQAVLFAPSVRVNAIAPGAMMPAKEEENSYFAKLEQIIPMKSTGNINALTDAYSFLVNNDYITGHILPVDGGLNLI